MKRLALLLLSVIVGCMSLHAQTYIQPTGKVLLIDSENYYVHVVGEGETIADIAKRYDVSKRQINDANEPLGWSGEVKGGEVLRIPCEKRLRELRPKRDNSEYIYHTAVAGESLFDIAKEYAVSLDVILEDNPTLDITNLPAFTSVLIRESEIRRTTIEVLGLQCQEYASVLNKLSANYEYIVVEKGQTLYSLSRIHGVEIETIKSENGNPEVIHIGMLLKVPADAVSDTYEEEADAESAIYEQEIPEVEQSELQEDETAKVGDVYFYLNSIINARTEGKLYIDLFRRKHSVTISMLLPLTDEAGRVRGSFVEFYQGALIAAEDMKAKGHSVNINLYDTRNSAEQVEKLMRRDRNIKDANLFIGPIYERNAEAVLDFAVRKDIPVVSPLETKITGEYGDAFFRMAPVDTNKYDKLRDLITPESNVILVYTASTNKAFESAVRPMLEGVNYTIVNYDDEFEVESEEAPTLQTALQRRNNLVFVLSNSEIEVDRVLTITSSMMNRYGGRGRSAVQVIGDSSWLKYKNIDRNLFFKLNVGFVANYHFDRTDEKVMDFDAKYIESFGAQPSLFAYRAYDAVKLFSTALLSGKDVHEALEDIQEPMLRTPYHFVFQDGIMVNDFWPFVQYTGTEIRVE